MVKATPKPGAGAPPRIWLDRVLALGATWIPFAVAMSRAASAGQWRDDLPAVRDLGLVAIGVGGGLSTLVTQALSLMPLGPRTFRAALGSAIALAVAGRLLYGLVRRTLDEASPSPRLAAALAAISTLTAALSPTWQREATVGGGAMIATALVLGALTLAYRASANLSAVGPRAWVAFGAITGAALAESPPAALAIAVATMSLVSVRAIWMPEHATRLPSPRTLGLGAAALAGAALLLLAPVALRPLAPRGWVDLGHALSATGLGAPDLASARTTALAAWVREIGVVSLGIAVFGAGTALLRGKSRALIAPFAALVVLDTMLPARAAGVLTADPLTALRALAVASIGAASALGVHEVVSRLLRAKIPLNKAAAVLVVVFHLTLIALTSEEAGFATDRSEQMAAEVWGDEALAELPPRAAILVRSPAVAWRLWAARLTRGERPDVLVIPIPLLDKGRVASSLLAAERETEPLLRDFALTGQPTEFALSKLADVRPLQVEFDASWSRRLVSHLRVEGLWLEYAPQPLGPSDRKASSVASTVPMKRVLKAIADAAVPEAPTATVVAATLRADANVLNALGEREAADLVLSRIEELSARDPAVTDAPLPYALKGLRRAVFRPEPARAR